MKIAIRVSAGRVRLIDAAEIYFIEARDHDTVVRTARKRAYPSTWRITDWEKTLRGSRFLRTHRSFLVNLDRVLEIRTRRDDSNDWELKLDPPVNTVLPVSRAGYAALRKDLSF
jgi:DNA-binding LytR/AlgR family response regulator